MPFRIDPPPLKTGRGTQWMIATLVALGPFALTMYQPAMPVIGASLNATPAEVQLTLTVYLAAFAVGQLIYGPLSDHFGRRRMLLVGLGVFVLGAAGCAIAGSAMELVAARVIQGLGACAGPALGRAMIRDLYDARGAARALAFVASALSVAPAIAPVFGGYIATVFGWQAIFVALAVIGAALLVFTLFRVPETNPYVAEGSLELAPLVAGYGTLLRSRVYLGYMCIAATATAGSLAFQSAAPFIVVGQFGVPPHVFGWFLVGLTASYFCGTLLAQRLARGSLIRTLMIGSALLTLSAALHLGFGFSEVKWVSSVILPQALWLVGLGVVLPAAMTGAIGPFPAIAGAAAALQGFAMMAGGAAASLALSRLGINVLALGVLMFILAVGGWAFFYASVARSRA